MKISETIHRSPAGTLVLTLEGGLSEDVRAIAAWSPQGSRYRAMRREVMRFDASFCSVGQMLAMIDDNELEVCIVKAFEILPAEKRPAYADAKAVSRSFYNAVYRDTIGAGMSELLPVYGMAALIRYGY